MVVAVEALVVAEAVLIAMVAAMRRWCRGSGGEVVAAVETTTFETNVTTSVNILAIMLEYRKKDMLVKR